MNNDYDTELDSLQSYILLTVFGHILVAYQQGKSFVPVINDYANSDPTAYVEDLLHRLRGVLGEETETAPGPEMWRYEHADYTQAVKQTLQLFAMRYKLMPFSPQEIDFDVDDLIDTCAQERVALLPDLLNAGLDEEVIFTQKGERMQMTVAKSFFVRAYKCLVEESYFEDTLKDIGQLLRFGPLPKDRQEPPKEIQRLLKKFKDVLGDDDGDIIIRISEL